LPSVPPQRKYPPPILSRDAPLLGSSGLVSTFFVCCCLFPGSFFFRPTSPTRMVHPPLSRLSYFGVLLLPWNCVMLSLGILRSPVPPLRLLHFFGGPFSATSKFFFFCLAFPPSPFAAVWESFSFFFFDGEGSFHFLLFFFRSQLHFPNINKDSFDVCLDLILSIVLPVRIFFIPPAPHGTFCSLFRRSGFAIGGPNFL